MFIQWPIATFQHMVVVITDGESNVKKDNTIPKAEQMHDEGMEVLFVRLYIKNKFLLIWHYKINTEV